MKRNMKIAALALALAACLLLTGCYTAPDEVNNGGDTGRTANSNAASQAAFLFTLNAGFSLFPLSLPLNPVPYLWYLSPAMIFSARYSCSSSITRAS